MCLSDATQAERKGVPYVQSEYVFVFNGYQRCTLCLSLSVADNKHPFIQKACFFGHNSHTFLHLCSVAPITIARNRNRE